MNEIIGKYFKKFSNKNMDLVKIPVFSNFYKKMIKMDKKIAK